MTHVMGCEEELWSISVCQQPATTIHTTSIVDMCVKRLRSTQNWIRCSLTETPYLTSKNNDMIIPRKTQYESQRIVPQAIYR
jgi:hypothetical protein